MFAWDTHFNSYYNTNRVYYSVLPPEKNITRTFLVYLMSFHNDEMLVASYCAI